MRRCAVGAVAVALLVLPEHAGLRARASEVVTGLQRQAKVIVTVEDFDYQTIKQEWAGFAVDKRGAVKPDKSSPMEAWNIGAEIADLFADHVTMQTGELVVERKGAGGAPKDRATEDSATHYLVAGSVVRFGGDVSPTQLTQAGNPFEIAKRIYRFTHSKGHVELSARVIRMPDGEIAGAIKAIGESAREGSAFKGIEPKGGAAKTGDHVMRSPQFQATIIGEATLAAVKDAAAKLVPLVRPPIPGGRS